MICTYSCAYCQVGRTVQMEVECRSFYSPQEIYHGVKEKVDSSQSQGLAIDYHERVREELQKACLNESKIALALD